MIHKFGHEVAAMPDFRGYNSAMRYPICTKLIIAINGAMATRLLAFVALGLGGVLLSLPAQAQVVSMSRVTTVLTDTGSYQQFSVNCGSRTALRFVRKEQGSREWCDAITGEYCARDRLKIAAQVCSRRYTSAMQGDQSEASNIASEVQTAAPQQQEPQESVSSQQPPATIANQAQSEDQTLAPAQDLVAQNSPSRTELEKELRDIEQQLIDLQAERLNLRAKDLELIKQQIEP